MMTTKSRTLWRLVFALVGFSLLLSVSSALAESSEWASDTEIVPRVCTRGDYVAFFGTCLANATRLREWKKDGSVSCTEDAAAQPPATHVPCARCPPGMQHGEGHLDSVSDCVGCPVGEFLDTTEFPSTCRVCPPGTAAAPLLAFRNGFDGFSGDLSALRGSTVRREECPSDTTALCTRTNGAGFDFVDYKRADDLGTVVVGLRPSRAHANLSRAVSTFTYAFEAEMDGWVEVTFVVQYVTDDYAAAARLDELQQNSSMLIVDGVAYDVRSKATAASMDADFVYSIAVPFSQASLGDNIQGPATRRTHTLSWVAQGIVAGAASPVTVMLSLLVSGDIVGGVEACEVCPAGFACPPRTTQASACAPGTHQPATHAQRCLPCAENTVAPGYGFRTCLACENGGVANADHSACTYNCTFAFDDVSYDLSEMAGVVLNATLGETSGTLASHMTVAEADAAGIDRVYVSLCDALSTRGAAGETGNTTADSLDALCVRGLSGHNSSSTAHVCERTNATVGRHFGGHVQLERGEDGQVSMITTMGSLLAPVDVRTSAAAYSERTWRSVIQFVCDVDGVGSANTLHVEGMAEDTLTLSWRSAHACSLCTEMTYQKVTSRCSTSSSYTVTYVKVNSTSPSPCAGGYVPPDPTSLPCTPCREEFYTLEWLACDTAMSTETGVYVVKPEHEDCMMAEEWIPKNQSRPCTATPVNTSAAKKLSAVIGAFVLVLAIGLAAAALFPGHLRQAQRVVVTDDGMELNSYTFTNDGADGLQAHYNVVDAVHDTEAEASRTADSRFSNIVGRLMSSVSGAIRRVGTPGSSRSRSPPLGGFAHGNDYSTLPTADAMLSEEESLPRPSQVDRSRRAQVMFALDDDDDDDILPPRSPQ